jgi:hypothetical protein
LNEPVKALPIRYVFRAPRPASSPSEGAATQQTKLASAPVAPNEETTGWTLGDLRTVAGQTGQTTQTIGSPLLPQKEAFSRAWANALEQSEATTAQRLRSTKGLALPLAEPKPAAQSPKNDNVSPGIFTNEKADPLPLVLSLSAPQPPPPEQKKVADMKDASGSISAVSSDEPADTPLSAPGELAFSAKIKSPGAEPDSGTPSGPSAPLKPVASPQSADTGSNATGNATGTNATGTSAASPAGKAELGAPPMSGSIANVVVNSEASTSPPRVFSASHAEPIDANVQTPASAPQPLKEIALQLPGARGVEVRVSEHAGEVRIDVRSGDTMLTQDLRGNLHDLVAGLERKGFSAEVSHVAERAAAPASRPSDTGASKDQPQDGQGGAFDRQPQQRNRQHGQQPEPANSRAGGIARNEHAWNEQANSSFEKENQ